MQLRRLGSAVALACALAADVPAQALSLADAVGGASLASGGLLFSDFQIAFAGTGRTEDSLWGALVRFQIDF